MSLTPYYERDGITIYHGDCREVLAEVEGDVLLTDPDYGVGVDYDYQDGALSLAAADALLVSMLRLAEVRTRAGVIFWSGSWRRIHGDAESAGIGALVDAGGWDIVHMGIWYKPNGAGGTGNGMARRFEPWFWIRQHGAEWNRETEWQRTPDVIAEARVMRHMHENWGHRTQKPVALIRRLIRFTSRPGDVVLDPFMGSGSTLEAALRSGRRAIGIDRNEAYCEMAATRLSQTVLPFVEEFEQPELLETTS